MKKYYNLFVYNHQPGFVILFTILIAAIIMTMGLGIYSIAVRQTALSGTAREAGQAFYAADAGVECALSAQQKGAFAGGISIMCNGETVTIPVSEVGNPSVFSINLGTSKNGSCAVVTVITDVTSRRIISQGYNLCLSGSPSIKNPRLVERDLDVVYEIANP